MAVKRCPSCQQSLPVACKSCPCGHIFITKKYNASSKDSEASKTNHSGTTLKRLRPERPKREIPDYEYCDDYTRISMNGDSQVKSISKRMKFFDDVDDEGCQEDNDDEDDAFANILSGKMFERSDSLEEAIKQGKKKRGRPRGSKNKPKDGDSNNDDYDDNGLKNPGKQKGSKGKTDVNGLPIKVKSKSLSLPPIPPEKVVVYSLILTDINEKLSSQNKMRCLPGI